MKVVKFIDTSSIFSFLSAWNDPKGSGSGINHSWSTKLKKLTRELKSTSYDKMYQLKLKKERKKLFPVWTITPRRQGWWVGIFIHTYLQCQFRNSCRNLIYLTWRIYFSHNFYLFPLASYFFCSENTQDWKTLICKGKNLNRYWHRAVETNSLIELILKDLITMHPFTVCV